MECRGLGFLIQQDSKLSGYESNYIGLQTERASLAEQILHSVSRLPGFSPQAHLFFGLFRNWQEATECDPNSEIFQPFFPDALPRSEAVRLLS